MIKQYMIIQFSKAHKEITYLHKKVKIENDFYFI